MPITKNLKLILVSLRPHQWVKNLLVFAAVVFSLNLFSWSHLYLAFLAFVAFCLLSGGVYLINDCFDLTKDRRDPDKSQRPLASGRLGLRMALVSALVILAVALMLGLLINPDFFFLALAYILLQLIYSAKLRQALFVDVLIVSVGFVLRAWAGAAAVKVLLSPWLLTCTFFLALTLVLGKRYFEPREYRRDFLERLMWVSATAALITYTIYAVVAPVGEGRLVFTIPWVVYGIFRYLYLVYYGDRRRSPTDVLVTDQPLLTNFVFWALLVVVLIYN